MNAEIEYNSKGGYRFNHKEPLKLGTYYMHLGQRVKLVGPGMAGMPEVEAEDGSTNLAYPHDLMPVMSNAKLMDGAQEGVGAAERCEAPFHAAPGSANVSGAPQQTEREGSGR